jgi:hypothetical protein
VREEEAPSIPAPPQPKTVPQPKAPPQSTAPTVTPPIVRPQAVAESNGHVHDFVCEDDVKRAIAAKEKIRINNRTIITPSARDLGEAHEIFTRNG